MTDNRTEEQQIRDEYETNREIIRARDAGEFTYDDSAPVPELPEATPDRLHDLRHPGSSYLRWCGLRDSNP